MPDTKLDKAGKEELEKIIASLSGKKANQTTSENIIDLMEAFLSKHQSAHLLNIKKHKPLLLKAINHKKPSVALFLTGPKVGANLEELLSEQCILSKTTSTEMFNTSNTDNSAWKSLLDLLNQINDMVDPEEKSTYKKYFSQHLQNLLISYIREMYDNIIFKTSQLQKLHKSLLANQADIPDQQSRIQALEDFIRVAKLVDFNATPTMKNQLTRFISDLQTQIDSENALIHKSLQSNLAPRRETFDSWVDRLFKKKGYYLNSAMEQQRMRQALQLAFEEDQAHGDFDPLDEIDLSYQITSFPQRIFELGCSNGWGPPITASENNAIKAVLIAANEEKQNMIDAEIARAEANELKKEKLGIYSASLQELTDQLNVLKDVVDIHPAARSSQSHRSSTSSFYSGQGMFDQGLRGSVSSSASSSSSVSSSNSESLSLRSSISHRGSSAGKK